MRRICLFGPTAMLLALPATALAGPPSLPEEGSAAAPAAEAAPADAPPPAAAPPPLADPAAEPAAEPAPGPASEASPPADNGGEASLEGEAAGSVDFSDLGFEESSSLEAEADDGAAAAGAAAADADAPGMVRGRKEPMANSLRGGVGLFHTALPENGGDKTFRFRLHTDFFRSEGEFLDDANTGETDTNSRLRGTVNIGFTPIQYVDMWLSVSSSANRNERNKPGRQDPNTVFALGDTEFGAKGAYRFKNGGIGLGGQMYLGLLSGSGRLLTERVNFGFDAIFGADLRHLTAKKVPVRFAANVGFFLDNSSKLVEWETITDNLSREVFRFGLGANNSRVRTRWAVDFPIRLGKEKQFGIDPFMEFSWDIATSQVDAFLPLTADIGEAPLPRSSNWLTLGVRANVFAGLFLDAGVDIATASPNFEFGPLVAPYTVILGLGYSAETKPMIKEVPVEAPAEAAPAPVPVLDGRIVGTVTDANGAPMPGVIVRFPGRAANDMLTDANGSFTSWRFSEGEVPVQLQLADGSVVDRTATVSPDADTRLDIQLEGAAPAAVPSEGIVEGAFTDESGAPVAVSLQVTGMGIDEPFASNEGGLIALALPAGDYTAVARAEGYQDATLSFTVASESTSISATLKKATPPETPNVRGTSRSIRLRKKIRYKGNGLDTRSHALLDEVAAFMNYHPEYRMVQIRVHTDDHGNASARSQARADAVKAYLVSKGVSPSRLEAKGYGDRSPVAVNLTAEGRAKNNRTELRATDYAPPAEGAKGDGK